MQKQLTQLRSVAGISTREVDRLAGLSEGYSSRIERKAADDLTTSVGVAVKVAALYDVSLDYLVKGEGPEPKRSKVLAAVEEARKRAGT